jgi:hypothetical protein
MFIQVVQGTVTDPHRLEADVRLWVNEVAPQATGWLGTTSGVTADGRGIAVVRFSSPEAAQQNSERPQQQEWWAKASQSFAGDVVFHNCTETFTFLGGGSDDAGFVQIIQGHSGDVARMREMMPGSEDEMQAARPDVMGVVVAVHDDGGFTQVVYFTSEEAARAGERSDSEREPSEAEREMASIFADAIFYDLTEPQLYTARS